MMYAVNDDTELSKRNLYLNEKFSEVITEEFQDFFYKGCIWTERERVPKNH